MAEYVKKDYVVSGLRRIAALAQSRRLIITAKTLKQIADSFNKVAKTINIVHCKDCEYCSKGENVCESWTYCRFYNRDVYDGFFCATGSDGKKNE